MSVDPTADFAYRRATPGVFRVFDFADARSLGKIGGGNWLNQPCATVASSTGQLPVLDPVVKSAGASALRFDLPGQHGGNYGQWAMRFSDDNKLQIRAGQSLYIQYRRRINAALANTFFYSGGSGGASGAGVFQLATPTPQAARYENDSTFSVAGDIRSTLLHGLCARTLVASNTAAPYYSYSYGKLVSWSYDAVQARTFVTLDISNGDPGASVPLHRSLDTAQISPAGGGQGGHKLMDVTQGAYGTWDPGTSPGCKLVNQTYYNTGWPILYQSLSATGLVAQQAGKMLLQNAIATCVYGDPKAVCFREVPDTWITYQLGVDLLDLVVNAAGTTSSWNWRCRLWAQLGDDPAQPVFDWNPQTPGYFKLFAGDPKSYGGLGPGLGKANFFPYFTDKAFDQTHDAGQCWYADIICATQRLPDFGASTILVGPPSTGVTTVATQAQLDQAVADCKTAYNSASVAAGSPTLDQQVSTAVAAQQSTDQAAITAANAATQTATTALSTLQAAVKAKAASLAQDASVDAQHVADLQALVP